MEVHASKASAVVVQRVPRGGEEWFLDWQRGVTAAAEKFPGYQATDIYSPDNSHQDQWVIVIHFNDEKALQNWLASPARDEWVKKLATRSSTFQVKTLPGGFGAWFLDQDRPGQAPPAGWKMVLTVVFGLFPTVMLLSIFVGPFTSPLGLAISMLIGNFLSVSILQWGVMPVLTRILSPWLHVDETSRPAQTFGVAALLLAVMAILAILFRLVTG